MSLRREWRTVRSSLPDISLHLEVTVLSAEVDISSKHHLDIRLSLRERHSWDLGEWSRQGQKPQKETEEAKREKRRKRWQGGFGLCNPNSLMWEGPVCTVCLGGQVWTRSGGQVWTRSWRTKNERHLMADRCERILWRGQVWTQSSSLGGNMSRLKDFPAGLDRPHSRASSRPTVPPVSLLRHTSVNTIDTSWTSLPLPFASSVTMWHLLDTRSNQLFVCLFVCSSV